MYMLIFVEEFVRPPVSGSPLSITFFPSTRFEHRPIFKSGSTWADVILVYWINAL